MGFFGKLFGGGDDAESFAGRELAGRDWNGKDLRGRDFHDADLISCTFQGANLENANFRGAKLGQCDFADANLRGASLDGAACTISNFTGACFEGASTSKTKFVACEGVPLLAHSSLEDIRDAEHRWTAVRQRLETLAAIAAGGAIGDQRAAKNVLIYAAKFRDRDFQVIAGHSGHVDVKVAVTMRGTFTVYYEREPRASRQGAGAERRHFLGPGVFLAGDAPDIERMLALLAGELATTIAHFMPAANVDEIGVSRTEVTVEFVDDVLAGDLAQRVRVALELVDSIARSLA